MNAELISHCTEKDLHKICTLIDQLISSWISDSDAELEEADKTEQKFKRCAQREFGQNLSWEDLDSFAKRIMYRCQLHNRCSFSCFKGKSGKYSCRLAKPSGKVCSTTITQLRKRTNEIGELILPKKDKHIDPSPKESPIPQKSNRIL